MKEPVTWSPYETTQPPLQDTNYATVSSVMSTKWIYQQQSLARKDIPVTKRIIERAEKAGYKALLVSVDLPVLDSRLNEARNQFKFPEHMRFAVLAGDADEMGLEDTYKR
ncbi:Hydroxyacid oxidase 1 [Aspergillus hancockii]|nr:Hydroxyacid oxidase 1 [Aspergillus hancockii]